MLKKQLVGYGVVTVLALILRLLAYDYALPFLGHVDEPLFYLWCSDTRGTLENVNPFVQQYQRVYPPGYLWFCAGVMNIADALMHWNPYIDIPSYAALLRLISALADTASAVIIMALLHRLSGYGAALLGGLLWAFSAPLINENVLMTPNAILLMLCGLCTYASAVSVLDERPGGAWVGTLAGLVAVLFKFAVFPIMLLPAANVLWLLWRWRWRALPHAAGTLILVSGFAAWLIFDFGVFTILEVAPLEAGQIREIGNLLMPQRYGLLFASLTYTFGLLTTVVIGGMLLWALSRWLPCRQWSRQAGTTLTIAIVGITLLLLTVLYTRTQHIREFNYVASVRYVSPAAMLLLIAACAWIGAAFFTTQRPRWRWLIVLLSVLGIVPAALINAAAHERPDTRLLTQRWLLANVPIGACVWTDNYDLSRTLAWSNGGGDIARILEKDLDMATIEYYPLAQTDCDYVILSGDDTTYQHPEIPLTLLQQFGGVGMNGVDVYIYTPLSIPQSQDAPLSSSDALLHLRGIIGTREGETIHALTFWQAETTPRADLSYFLYLTYPQDREQVLAIISEPLGNRLTASWSDPRELHMFRTAALTIPALEAGEYIVYLGIYNPQTGERLVLANGETTIEVLRWSVEQ